MVRLSCYLNISFGVTGLRLTTSLLIKQVDRVNSRTREKAAVQYVNQVFSIWDSYVWMLLKSMLHRF